MISIIARCDKCSTPFNDLHVEHDLDTLKEKMEDSGWLVEEPEYSDEPTLYLCPACDEAAQNANMEEQTEEYESPKYASLGEQLKSNAFLIFVFVVWALTRFQCHGH